MAGVRLMVQTGKTAVMELKLGQYIKGDKGDKGETGDNGAEGAPGSLTPEDVALLQSYTDQAADSATAASGSATAASNSAADAAASAASLGDSVSQAAASATAAQTSAQNAYNYATTALGAQGAAEGAQQAAEGSQQAAEAAQAESEQARDQSQASQTAAKTSETNAAASAAAAATSQTAAKTSETNAAASAAAAAASAGSFKPAGTDKQIQFNDAGAFAGSANFYYDKTTNTLWVGAAAIAGNLTFNGAGAVVYGDSLNFLSRAANSDFTLNFFPSGTATASNLNLYSGQAGAAPAGMSIAASKTGSVFSSFANGPNPAQPFIWYVGGLEAMRLSGSLFIGTKSQLGPFTRVAIKYDGAGSQYGMSLQPVIDNTVVASFQNAAGTNVGAITQTASGVTYAGTCDYRLKTEVADIGQDGYERVMKARPRRVIFINDPDQQERSSWFAHEFQEAFGQGVTGEKDATDKDGKPVYQQLDDSYAIPDMVATFHVMRDQIAALSARVAELEGANHG